ncbi:MAG: CDP-alcohol phosphatidyltransferase family protein [Qipengyuania vulgaris]
MEPAFDTKTKPIERIQENLVARVERRVLNWLCARLPRAVSPDMLTAFGMLGALMVFGGYIGSNYSPYWLWLAVAGYVVHWFGDSLDGSVARFRKIERPRYGYFLDHSCDGLATTLLVVGIGLTPYVELEVALIALAGYLLMSIHAFLSVRVFGELRLSYMNAGPTELRMVLIAFTITMFFMGHEKPLIGHLNGFDLFVGVVGIGLIALFVFQTLQTAKRLAVEEPPRN